MFVFVDAQAESSDTVTYSVQLDKDHQQLGILLGMLLLQVELLKVLYPCVQVYQGMV